MKIIVKETGNYEDLRLIDEKTGEDFSAEIVENSGDVGRCVDVFDGVYYMSKDSFEWWKKYFEITKKYNCEIAALREKYGEAVDYIINQPYLRLSDDYNEHEKEMRIQIETIKEELEQK